MNSAEKQEAIKAISMKILDTVLEEKKDESSINEIFDVAFDQLVQTCPIKGGSSQKLLPRRAASAGPLPMVSRLRKEVLEEVDRRAQLPIIETKENESKKEEKNEKRLEEIETELCKNQDKWKKIFADRVSNQLREQIRNSITYILVLFMAFKLGLQEADPTSKNALIGVLLQAIVTLAIQVQATYTNTTIEVFEHLEKEKYNLLSKKRQRIARKAEERAKRAAERARMSHAITHRGRGGGNRRTTRKVRN